MNSILSNLLIYLSITSGLVESAKILAILPLPFRDHQILFRPLIKKLTENGHRVTLLTTDPLSFDMHNVDIIDLSFAHNLKVLNELSESDQSGSDIVRVAFSVMRTIAEAELKSGQVQILLRNHTENFDAVLVDWSGPSIMNGFAYYFCAPLIGITPGDAYTTSHEAMGNPNHPAVFSNVLLPFSEDLSLMQRVMNTFFSLWYRYVYLYEELPKQNEIAKELFGQNIPSLWEIEKNADLLLINSYQALGYTRPVGPTTVYLGGLHVSNPKFLPHDLELFLSGSTDPVAYINLGGLTNSFIKSDRLNRLFNILDKVGLDIIWNTNGLTVDVNTTSRMYRSPVIPQEDVLGHKKINLFISTGGQRDIEDAIHKSIPVLGLTFSSNVEHYLRQIIKYEAGLVSHFDRESNEFILLQINELLQSSSYKKNMKELNSRISDQPQNSLERANWWIEYILRNGGTRHLRHPLNQLPWFQYMLLDVFAVFFLTVVTVIVIFANIFLRLRRYSKSLPFEKVTRRTKQKLM